MKSAMFLLIFILFFIFTSCNSLVGLRSEKNIGQYILKNTAVGSSKEDVEKFIEKRKYVITKTNIRDKAHLFSPYGVIHPNENSKYIERKRDGSPYFAGSSNIEVTITEYIFTYVMCTWIFDDEKLILIEIVKGFDGT